MAADCRGCGITKNGKENCSAVGFTNFIYRDWLGLLLLSCRVASSRYDRMLTASSRWPSNTIVVVQDAIVGRQSYLDIVNGRPILISEQLLVILTSTRILYLRAATSSLQIFSSGKWIETG